MFPSKHVPMSQQPAQFEALHSSSPTQFPESHTSDGVQVVHISPPLPHDPESAPGTHSPDPRTHPRHSVGATHRPATHAVPAPHSWHTPAPAPHAFGALPARHSDPKQHPAQSPQVEGTDPSLPGSTSAAGAPPRRDCWDATGCHRPRYSLPKGLELHHKEGFVSFLLQKAEGFRDVDPCKPHEVGDQAKKVGNWIPMSSVDLSICPTSYFCLSWTEQMTGFEKRGDFITHDTKKLWGREHDLEAIARCFEEARTVLLVGPPGVGKSAVARSYPAIDRVDVDLSAAMKADCVVTAIANSIGVTLSSPNCVDRLGESVAQPWRTSSGARQL